MCAGKAEKLCASFCMEILHGNKENGGVLV